MGAISCLRHGRTPAEMIARDLAWENDETRREIVAQSLGHRGGNWRSHGFLAIRVTKKATGASYVCCVTALYDTALRQGHDWCVKYVDECMGPADKDCPASILKLLTPLPEIEAIEGAGWTSYAKDWREAAAAWAGEATAVKAVVKVGARIRLPEALRFRGGEMRQEFEVVRRGKRGMAFKCLADGVLCGIPARFLTGAEAI